MILAEYCHTMALYNQWQNRSLVAAADGLTDTGRRQERGAFFGSIKATFNHLLWDDALWLARFAGDERPEDSLPVSLEHPGDWAEFKKSRQHRDLALIDWAHALKNADLAGNVAWFPGGSDQRIEKPRALCIVHLFNPQTHHRGQIHAMLTAAGAHPEPTDLPMLARPS